MSTATNGTVKKIIAGLVTALLLFIIMQVLGNTNRIIVLETDMRTLKESIQTLRQENRDEHKMIQQKLDEIAKEMRK